MPDGRAWIGVALSDALADTNARVPPFSPTWPTASGTSVNDLGRAL